MRFSADRYKDAGVGSHRKGHPKMVTRGLISDLGQPPGKDQSPAVRKERVMGSSLGQMEGPRGGIDSQIGSKYKKNSSQKRKPGGGRCCRGQNGLESKGGASEKARKKSQKDRYEFGRLVSTTQKKSFWTVGGETKKQETIGSQLKSNRRKQKGEDILIKKKEKGRRIIPLL